MNPYFSMNQNDDDEKRQPNSFDVDDESNVYFLQQAYEYHERLVEEENRPILTRNLIHRDREGAEERLKGDYFDDHFKKISIDAPNLCYLLLMGSDGMKAPRLNVASCKKLTTVDYYGNPSPTGEGLADFSSNFPYLETLLLCLPELCKSLKLSSHSLRTFVLHSECDLDELDINTPNLLSFDYKGTAHSPFPVERESVVSKARMECYPSEFVNTLWFQKLRQFLSKKVGFKELKLCLSAHLFNAEELKLIQGQPFELDHVDLKPDIIKELSIYLAIVDGVLWCCRPRSLTLESNFPSINFEEWSHIVKFTYEKLIQQEDPGHTNIQFVMSSSSEAKKHFGDLTSLLAALPHDGLRQTITVIKEEVPKYAHVAVDLLLNIPLFDLLVCSHPLNIVVLLSCYNTLLVLHGLAGFVY
ncbi:hypothetical protein Tco_0999580 [Tanacetum coccineum]